MESETYKLSSISTISLSDSVTSDVFYQEFLLGGYPCLLTAGFTKEWKCRKDWVIDDSPNFDFLRKYSDDAVPVVNCKRQYFNSQEKFTMTFGDFLSYWQNSRTSVAKPDGQIQEVEGDLLYLKDWHFQRSHPDYKAYEVPKHFQSDWLNEYYDQKADANDDYRFVYMGPKGTWTPFHADVFRSFSWSANICGRKRWLLFPPGEEENLRDTVGNLPFDVTSADMLDQTRYPNFSKCHAPIEVIQNEGEIIFVPSGWHHQVHNMEDTISINHNWVNGCCIGKMWNHLRSELALVENEIQDCSGMEGWHKQCQVILLANSGMDYREFVNMLLMLAEPRCKTLMTLEYFLDQSKPSRLNKETLKRILSRMSISSVPKSHLLVKVEKLSNSLLETDTTFLRGWLKYFLNLKLLPLVCPGNSNTTSEVEVNKRFSELNCCLEILRELNVLAFDIQQLHRIYMDVRKDRNWKLLNLGEDIALLEKFDSNQTERL